MKLLAERVNIHALGIVGGDVVLAVFVLWRRLIAKDTDVWIVSGKQLLAATGQFVVGGVKHHSRLCWRQTTVNAACAFEVGS